jgi:hypothetical protein
MRRPPQEGENLIARFFRRLASSFSRLERERREAYLAGATDVYDLERRIRQLENPTEHRLQLPSR